MVKIVLQKLLQMEFLLLFIWLNIYVCLSKESALCQNIDFCLFVCDLMLHFALQYINVDVLMVQKET